MSEEKRPPNIDKVRVLKEDKRAHNLFGGRIYYMNVVGEEVIEDPYPITDIIWSSLICFFLGWVIGGLVIWWSTFLTSDWTTVIIAVGSEFFGASIAGFMLVTTDL